MKWPLNESVNEYYEDRAWEAEHHCPGPLSAELTMLSMPLGKTAHPQGPLGLSKGFPVANQGLLGTQVQTCQGAACSQLFSKASL